MGLRLPVEAAGKANGTVQAAPAGDFHKHGADLRRMFRAKPEVVGAVVDKGSLSGVGTGSVLTHAPVLISGFASPKDGLEITMFKAGFL